MPSDPALKSTAAANALGMGRIDPAIVRMRARGDRKSAIEGEFDDLDPLGSTE